jgi:hypothetical protein
VTCSLTANGGCACVTADDSRFQELADIDAVLAHLTLFNDPDVPPLEIRG